ncbi:DUF4357 domain-containing protein [Gottfriedia acidiceleris]|uniref:DUF4357 domain-containing protein n=1 Tax=Gottfriedia acidiceleris TaxID=371036 RepID=UPI002FFFF4D5
MLQNLSNQIIFYGPPGTGKSYNIQQIIEEQLQTSEVNVFRTVFHPEYDYSDFVGTYRPIMEKLNNKEERLNYKFIPGILLRAYLAACKTDEPVILVIDEVNRGNCSAVFGDFFQLLDRNPKTGASQYSIDIPLEMSRYLNESLYMPSDNELKNQLEPMFENIKIAERNLDIENHYLKLTFPNNFYIFATMNTSDQSVFPIDSAFIRRWSWRYQGINYTDAEKFLINIYGSYYSWAEFLKTINERIYSLTESEDKQLGNRFIMPFGNTKIINTNDYVEKVLFYLWNEIFKHEDSSNEDYIFKYHSSIYDNEEHEFTFSQLFDDDREEILKGFMEYNGIIPVEVDEMDLEFDEQEQILRSSNTSYYKKPEKDIPVNTEIYLSYHNIKANALYKGKDGKNELIQVLAGSQMSINFKETIPTDFKRIREELISEGIVEKRSDFYVFVRDHIFKTSSEAAGIIGGARLTGPEMWKTSDRKTLNNLKGKK